ncbi:MAG: lasso peptide biosynthesis B2 protein [Candidatus Binataceae bacterium]
MARRLAKFFQLPLADQRLLMRAALAVVGAKLAIRTLHLPAARAAVTRLECLGWIVMQARADRIVWAVEVAGRAIPGMKNCLVQAVAAEAMLIRAGHPCELRIGAAKNRPGQLIAHAWLESEGRVLIGEFELDRYTPLFASHLQGDAPSARR